MRQSTHFTCPKRRFYLLQACRQSLPASLDMIWVGYIIQYIVGTYLLSGSSVINIISIHCINMIHNMLANKQDTRNVTLVIGASFNHILYAIVNNYSLSKLNCVDYSPQGGLDSHSGASHHWKQAASALTNASTIQNKQSQETWVPMLILKTNKKPTAKQC